MSDFILLNKNQLVARKSIERVVFDEGNIEVFYVQNGGKTIVRCDCNNHTENCLREDFESICEKLIFDRV